MIKHEQEHHSPLDEASFVFVGLVSLFVGGGSRDARGFLNSTTKWKQWSDCHVLRIPVPTTICLRDSHAT